MSHVIITNQAHDQNREAANIIIIIIFRHGHTN